MTLIAYLHTFLAVRLAELRRDGERGDSPVPTAVIIMGLVVVATVVTAGALAAAKGWLDKIPAPGDVK
ncbi:hypothetical protein GCM10027280_61850 [Micromonospora polyrhachis]|uniref:Uncharacterized protein n=1 Tax=Micromonospora polyrhachis TaxID=1282883 RepID=A0A7W7WP03_9ACTN|nr:hypothetical protein [Micromonospora polyrhachis]MBB4958696.1 hypothetical protein [Micromonospora polyrhachis]